MARTATSSQTLRQVLGVISTGKARRSKTLLMGGTLLASLCAPALAAEPQSALEKRVDRLEAKLDQILDRLETDNTTLTSEEDAALRSAAKVLADANADPGGANHVATTAAASNDVILEIDTPGGTSAQTQKSSTSVPNAQPTSVLPDMNPAIVAANSGIGFSIGKTAFAFKGYVKLDASIQEFSDGDLPSGSLGRDFYIPGLVPVGSQSNGADFDFNPRETRFIFDVDTERGGHKLGGLIELDFQVTSDGNERVSNSFTPRMRQAYITFDNWLLGQTWSTFQDVSALPDNLDFIGPTEGTVFIRQPMIRYTKGPFQIALEQPETEVTGPSGERLLPGDDVAPDVVVRYNKKRDWGHLTLAGIGRALHVEEDIIAGAQSDTVLGYGISASGKLKIGARDDFRFMATYGEGIGRYIGVNIVNDVAVGETGELETIPTFSAFASYRHFWTPTLRSNITGGYFKADNPVELVGDGVTDEVYSAHVNLIFTPVEKFDVGIEYIYATRALENGTSGNLNKLQFSTKYSF